MTGEGFTACWMIAADDGDRSLFKVLILVAVVVVSLINSALKSAKARAAERARTPATEVPRTDSDRDGHPEWPAKPPPTPRAPRPDAVRTRRTGSADDVHTDTRVNLPTSHDVPGAHAIDDHVRLTEIGADRGTASKRPGDHPTAAATVAKRGGATGHDLLRSTDLRGKDRVRAGILWAEVFGPPRSRARR